MTTIPEDAALIVVDMQEDFCEPNGALAVKGGRDLASGINKALELPFKLKVATQDNHPADHCSFASQHRGAEPFTSSHTIKNPEATGSNVEEQTTLLWPDHCVQGTHGVKIIPELQTSQLSHVVTKGEDKRVESYSGFGPPFREPPVAMTSLQSTLQDAGIRKVYVTGVAYDFCVKSTAIDAAKAGFETVVVEDLTKPVDGSAGGLAATRKELNDNGVQIVQSIA